MPAILGLAGDKQGCAHTLSLAMNSGCECPCEPSAGLAGAGTDEAHDILLTLNKERHEFSFTLYWMDGTPLDTGVYRAADRSSHSAILLRETWS